MNIILKFLILDRIVTIRGGQVITDLRTRNTGVFSELLEAFDVLPCLIIIDIFRIFIPDSDFFHPRSRGQKSTLPALLHACPIVRATCVITHLRICGGGGKGVRKIARGTGSNVKPTFFEDRKLSFSYFRPKKIEYIRFLN